MRFKSRGVIAVLAAVALAVVLAAPAAAIASDAPYLVSPSNGATVPRNAPNGWYPYLDWGSNNPDLTTYLFEIATNPAQLSDGSFYPDYQVLGDYGIFETYYDYGSRWPYTYLLPGTYYWHVRDMFPSGGTGFSAWSATWSFTVPPPGASEFAMNVQPSALTWEIKQGDPNPAPRNVTFDCYGPSGTTYSWRSTPPNVSWVTETQLDNRTCQYSINAAGLAPGKYEAIMPVEMFRDSGMTQHIAGSPYSFPITLIVTSKSGSTGQACSVSAPKASGKASAKRGTKLVGAVTPGHSTRVTVEVQRYKSKKYRSYKKYSVGSTASGAYALKKKFPRGTYRVRALAAAAPGYREAASGWRKIVVK